MLLHLAVLTTANVVEPEPGFVSEFSAPASRKSLKNTRDNKLTNVLRNSMYQYTLKQRIVLNRRIIFVLKVIILPTATVTNYLVSLIVIMLIFST